MWTWSNTKGAPIDVNIHFVLLAAVPFMVLYNSDDWSTRKFFVWFSSLWSLWQSEGVWEGVGGEVFNIFWSVFGSGRGRRTGSIKTPEKVPGIEAAMQVACGYSHTVVVANGSQVWSFGNGDYGEGGKLLDQGLFSN